MRVFATGGTGFVGAHVVSALLRAGHDVVLLARTPAAAEACYRERGLPIPPIVEGSMTDADVVARGLEGCDAVVHAAAMVGLDTAQQQRTYETNVRGVETVVGGAHARGIPNVVYVSSAVTLFHPGSSRLDEDSPVASSSNPYSRSKIEGERIVRRLQAEGAAIQTLYPTTVIGPDDPGQSEGNKSVQVLADRLRLLTSGGMQFVDVRDVAEAALRLLERGCPEEPTRARYVTSGRFVPWPELVDLVDEVCGERRIRVPVNGALLRGLGSVCDVVKHVLPFSFPLTREAMEYATNWTPASSEKIEHELGFEHRPVEITLRDTIGWMRRTGAIRPA